MQKWSLKMPDVELSSLECKVPGRRDQSAALSPVLYLLTGSPIQINTCLPLFLLLCVCVCVCVYYYFVCVLTFAWMSLGSILLRTDLMGSSSPVDTSVMNTFYYSGITTCSFPKPFGYLKWIDPSRRPRMVTLMQERRRRSKRGSDLGPSTGLE